MVGNALVYITAGIKPTDDTLNESFCFHLPELWYITVDRAVTLLTLIAYYLLRYLLDKSRAKQEVSSMCIGNLLTDLQKTPCIFDRNNILFIFVLHSGRSFSKN